MNVFHFYNHFFLWPDNFDEDFSFFKNGFYGNYILYSFFDTFKKGSSFCHLILSLHITVCPSIWPFLIHSIFLQQIFFVQCMSTSETETTATYMLPARIMNMVVNLCQYY